MAVTLNADDRVGRLWWSDVIALLVYGGLFFAVILISAAYFYSTKCLTSDQPNYVESVCAPSMTPIVLPLVFQTIVLLIASSIWRSTGHARLDNAARSFLQVAESAEDNRAARQGKVREWFAENEAKLNREDWVRNYWISTIACFVLVPAWIAFWIMTGFVDQTLAIQQHTACNVSAVVTSGLDPAAFAKTPLFGYRFGAPIACTHPIGAISHGVLVANIIVLVGMLLLMIWGVIEMRMIHARFLEMRNEKTADCWGFTNRHILWWWLAQSHPVAREQYEQHHYPRRHASGDAQVDDEQSRHGVVNDGNEDSPLLN